MSVALAYKDVSVNGQIAYRKGEYFRRELSVNNATAPIWQQVTVSATDEPTVTGHVFVPRTPEQFTYDLDGNLTSDGRWVFTWDAENRLLHGQSLPTSPSGSHRRVEWTYDAKGRRIGQKTSLWTNSTWVVVEDLKFISDPMSVGRHIAELNATNNALVRSYVWGLDLSDSLDGAGGVGGLLWVRQHSGSAAGVHYCAYDGNGNIAALSAASDGSETARYEYAPFGEPIRVTGPMAKENPFRFSTKRTDNTTDFVLYEYRAYNPTIGRWPNRDPLGEVSGFNLYGFVGNNPIQFHDPLGLAPAFGPGPFPIWPPDGKPPRNPIPGPWLGPDDTVPGDFSGIALCQRPLREEDCKDKVLNKCGLGHKFLARFLDGKPIEGYGFYPSGKVEQEKSLDCPRGNPCKPTDKPLKYGTGAPHKTGKTASIEEIMDCIKSRPPLGPYEAPVNDCRHWAARTATDCGLDCGQ